MNLSETIRHYRLARGYTQEQLAARLGVSAQAVSKWETSETYPDGALLVPLANALDVSLDTLFGNRTVSMKELSEDIKQLIASVPGERSFQTVRDICWQIEKGLFNCRMTIDEPYDPEELNTLEQSSYILNDYGFTHVSNGRAPFFLAVPETEHALAEVIGDGEEIRKIFTALSSPETMRAVLSLYRRGRGYLMEKEVLADQCGIGQEQIDGVIQDLMTLRLISACDIEADSERRTLYAPKPSHLLTALFLLAHEMQYRGYYCYQTDFRNKPYLT